MIEGHQDRSDLKILAVDIGGSHVKLRASTGGEERRVESGPAMTGQGMIDAVRTLSKGLDFNVVAIGYPGPVVHDRPIAEPANLGISWVGLDYAAAFGCPVRVVNDALMQAIGSYNGGRMLFLGLGTGLGAAMIVEKVAQPMEIAHLPYRKGKSYEHYVCEAYRQRHGSKLWRKRTFDVIERLAAALEPDDIVIGGGNVTRLHELPSNCRRGANVRAFEGGFRLWRDESLKV
jgi:polyphosphate glucokinase